MKKHIYLLFILFAFQSFAGKTYTITYHVISTATEDAVVGMIVELHDGSNIVDVKTTDIDGKVVFENISLKSFSVHGKGNLSDFSGFYDHEFNKEKQDIDKKIFVRFSREKSIAFFKERDLLYKDNDDPFLDFLSSDPAKKNCEMEDAVEASFPGGTAELQRYLGMNLQYPQESIEKDEQGKVYLTFIIEKSGIITNVEVERGVSPSLDFEAKMLIYNMPRWNPCKCGDIPMRIKIRLPVNFNLN